MIDNEKLNVKTEFSYVVKSSVYSKNYFYIVEIEKDGFGETERAITKPLTKKELNNLSNAIQRAIPNIIKSH